MVKIETMVLWNKIVKFRPCIKCFDIHYTPSPTKFSNMCYDQKKTKVLREYSYVQCFRNNVTCSTILMVVDLKNVFLTTIEIIISIVGVIPIVVATGVYIRNLF